MSSSDQHSQSPSDPAQTSASRAFTQLEYDEQKRIAKAIEKRDNEFTTLADGVAAEHRHLFGAYELDPDAPPRDDTHDEYNFEVSCSICSMESTADPVHQVVKGLFQQSDPALPKLLLENVLDESFGLLDKSAERWSNMQQKVSGAAYPRSSGLTVKLIQRLANRASAQRRPERDLQSAIPR